MDARFVALHAVPFVPEDKQVDEATSFSVTLAHHCFGNHNASAIYWCAPDVTGAPTQTFPFALTPSSGRLLPHSNTRVHAKFVGSLLHVPALNDTMVQPLLFRFPMPIVADQEMENDFNFQLFDALPSVNEPRKPKAPPSSTLFAVFGFDSCTSRFTLTPMIMSGTSTPFALQSESIVFPVSQAPGTLMHSLTRAPSASASATDFFWNVLKESTARFAAVQMLHAPTKQKMAEAANPSITIPPTATTATVAASAAAPSNTVSATSDKRSHSRIATDMQPRPLPKPRNEKSEKLCRVCRLRQSFDQKWSLGSAATEDGGDMRTLRCAAHRNESSHKPQMLTLPRVWVTVHRLVGAGFFYWLRSNALRVPFKTFAVAQPRNELRLSFVITQRPIQEDEAAAAGLVGLSNVAIKIADDGTVRAADPMRLLIEAQNAIGATNGTKKNNAAQKIIFGTKRPFVSLTRPKTETSDDLLPFLSKRKRL